MITLLISPLSFNHSWSFSNSFSCSPSLLTLFQLLTILILTFSYLYFFQSSIMLSVFHLFTTLNNSTLLFTSSLYRDHTLAISQLLSHSHSFDFSFLLYYSYTLLLSLSLIYSHLSLAQTVLSLLLLTLPAIPRNGSVIFVLRLFQRGYDFAFTFLHIAVAYVAVHITFLRQIFHSCY